LGPEKTPISKMEGDCCLDFIFPVIFQQICEKILQITNSRFSLKDPIELKKISFDTPKSFNRLLNKNDDIIEFR